MGTSSTTIRSFFGLRPIAGERSPLRDASVELAAGPPDAVMNVVRRYVHGGPRTRKGTTSARLPRHLHTVLLSTYERAPKDFETLLGLEGVGARTLRALALVSEVIYDTPFPVDRATYDRTVDTLHRAMAHAKVDRSDKVDALKRLGRFAKSTEPDSNNLH